MQAIATQLGVHHSQIVRDLKEFVHDAQTQPRTSARGRKNEGRPKGTTRPRKSRPKQTDAQHDQIIARHDSGLTSPQIASELGIEGRAVRHAIEREEIRRNVEPTITSDMLSMSMQAKLDAAVRQHKRRLDLEFEVRVRDEIKKRMDEIVLPHWKEKIDKANDLYRHRRGAMDKATFNKIRRALHPDSRASISDQVLAEAFDTFMSLEKFLLDENDSPTHIGDLPRTWDEWEKAKQAASAARKAKRTAGTIVRR